MKRKFTKLAAVFALLAALCVPLGMWGQQVVSGTTYSTPSVNGLPEGWSGEGGGTSYIQLTHSSDYIKTASFEQNGFTSIVIKARKYGGPDATQAKISVSWYDLDNSETVLGTIDPASTSLSNYTISSPAATNSGTGYIKIQCKNASSNKGSGVSEVTITYTAPGVTPVETVATPAFSPEAGTYTSTQTVSISCETTGATIYYTTDGSDPTTSSSVYSSALTISETTTVKAMAAKEGMNNSAVATAEYTITTPYTGDDYVRVTELGALTDGARVILAARYNTTATAYYAMTAATTGKPTGVSFTSTTSSNGEVLPESILNSESTYYWTVNVTSEGYKFTNSSDQVLGYTSGTNFATGGNNIAWTIARSTAGDEAMVSGYEGFYIVNKNSSGRGIALNNSYNYGPYSTGNNNSNDYNFYLDIFVQGYVPSSVATPTFSLEEGVYIGEKNVEIECETEGATIYYTLDGTDPTSESTEYTGAITISTTTTIKAIAILNNKSSLIATATYTFVVIEHDGTEADPYSVADARNAIDVNYGVTGVYATGIVTRNIYFNENNGQISYFISDDGTNTMELEAYNGLNIGGEPFESQDDIQVGDIVVIYGDLKKYNSTYEFDAENQLVSLVRPQITEPNVITDGTLTHVSISGLWDGDTFDDITLGDAVEVGTTVYFSLTVDEGYTLESVTVLDADNEEVSLTEASESWYFTMPNSSVTINATATESSVTPVTGDKYVKVTSTTDLTSGQYLIVYESGNVAFNGGLETLDAVGNTIAVTISNNEIAVSETTAAAEFTIDVTAGTIKSASGYYIGRTASSNGMNSSTTESYINTITFDEDYNAVVTSSGGPTLRYNDASNQTRFRYYGSGQKAIQLYKKVEATPAGYPYTVNGYGTSAGGYVLMATPTVANADPASVGMITDQLGASATPDNSKYDLYYYDQAQDKEWRNYRANDFELVPGKGYLYASKNDVTLNFTGELNPSFTDVTLPYTEGDFTKSIYLAGNSSTEAQTFYVYDFDNDLELQTVNFLTINGTGDGFTTATATSLTAQPMQGFFVQAAGSNWILSTEDLSDGTNSNQGVSLLNINVLRDRGNVIDNAIVSFSNGSMMNKFYLRDNTTRVYIPQDNREMAVVRSANEGEMPVSFRASENGTYTLAVETENVEMNYLHLIDNMTGMDVDLLQTPSYTFEAKTNDYTNRFRLVFSASDNGASTGSATFAYYNGSNWTVSNLGEATLQVVDVMGRLVSTEQINGNATINLNETPGIYMLRLVNGNSVKVQKVVVR